MFTRIYICLLLLTVNYLFLMTALPTRNADIENSHLTDALMFEQLHDRSYVNDEKSDEDENFNDKRQVKRKWMNYYQGSSSAHSPYTIAFPALIRSRRWIH